MSSRLDLTRNIQISCFCPMVFIENIGQVSLYSYYYSFIKKNQFKKNGQKLNKYFFHIMIMSVTSTKTN